MISIAKLEEFLFARYDKKEFPALLEQINFWKESNPLAGVKILDATPVFYNTGLKYLALLYAGADLTVSAHPALPSDVDAVKFFLSCGIPVVSGDSRESFDCICDCAGMHKNTPSKYGVVELTGSGAHAYRNWEQPVFLADGGKVKVLETGLGTGNGLLRALQQLGADIISGREILIFGGGKVGSGVALALDGAGAHCTIVDQLDRIRCKSSRVSVLSTEDKEAIVKAIANSSGIVTATGIKNAVANYASELLASDTVLMNIGVEDEYGADIPENRVLNHKKPLNFILDEPTLLRYIDPTMALSNYGVTELLNDRCTNGINLPPEKLENSLLEAVSRGAAAADLPKLEEFYYE